MHTKYCQSFIADTLTALLQCKMNVDANCCQLDNIDEEVKLAKCVLVVQYSSQNAPVLITNLFL